MSSYSENLTPQHKCELCGALLMDHASGRFHGCSDMCQGSRLKPGRLDRKVALINHTLLRWPQLPTARPHIYGSGLLVDGFEGTWEVVRRHASAPKAWPQAEGMTLAWDGKNVLLLKRK